MSSRLMLKPPLPKPPKGEPPGNYGQTVVLGTLLFIREYGIGFLNLFEHFFGVVLLTAVGMAEPNFGKRSSVQAEADFSTPRTS